MRKIWLVFSVALACSSEGGDTTAADTSAAVDVGGEADIAAPTEDVAVDTAEPVDVPAAPDVPTEAPDATEVPDMGMDPDVAAVEDVPDVPVCVPACEGKNCGQDGCGGVCGYCNADFPECVEGVCQPYCPTCQQHGTVLAPEGTIPIRGALVWATKTPPSSFPEGVFCDTCVDLPKGTPHAFSGVDGKFNLPITSEGEWTIVVQKGTFRRVRTLNIVAGQQELGKEVTALPSKTDLAAGDQIPSMIVVADTYDEIENTLGKLGLGEVDEWGYLDEGTESFELVDEYDAEELFTDEAELAKYQIIFMPCASGWFFPTLEAADVQGRLREWVQKGGRLYVTDWSYDILKVLFPDPIKWLGDDGDLDSAQLGSSYDGKGQVLDDGLKLWLDGQGLTQFDLLANWTIIESVSKYTAPDVDGTLVEMEPTVWMNVVTPDDGSRPATVSFQWGCGRGMFSTYHSEDGEDFLPQEKSLAYILFEVALCADTKYEQ